MGHMCDRLWGMGDGCGSRGLPYLWAVNPVEPDAFSAVVMQDFDGVAVEHGDDRPKEVGSSLGIAEEEENRAQGEALHHSHPHEGLRDPIPF